MSYWRHGELERQRRLGFAKVLLFLFREELHLLVSRTAVPCDKRIHDDGRLSGLNGGGFDVRCAIQRFPSDGSGSSYRWLRVERYVRRGRTTTEVGRQRRFEMMVMMLTLNGLSVEAFVHCC